MTAKCILVITITSVRYNLHHEPKNHQSYANILTLDFHKVMQQHIKGVEKKIFC